MTPRATTVHDGSIDTKLLTKLLKQAEPYGERLGPYPGVSWRDLERYNSYEEPGSSFRMTAEDMYITQLYAGLAVFTRDVHKYLESHPRDDAAAFREVVAAVHQVEQARYGATSFPYDDRSFGFQQELEAFPTALAENAIAGKPDLKWLSNSAIRHEWTVKPGKRLLLKFGEKFKIVICGTDGPYEQFNDRPLTQAALPVSIASQILSMGVSVATLWYPLAVYVALLLVKTGLKTYCESDLLPVFHTSVD